MLLIQHSNIVPEYSFLDARGLGAYEGKNLESISEVSFQKFVYGSLCKYEDMCNIWSVQAYLDG